MVTELFMEGVQLMVAGMGAVFVFLTLLVFATTLMSRVILHFQPLVEVADDVAESDEMEVAAITAAIAYHRQNSK